MASAKSKTGVAFFKSALLGAGLPLFGVSFAYIATRVMGLSWFTESFSLTLGAMLWTLLIYSLPPRDDATFPRPFRKYLPRFLIINTLIFMWLAVLTYNTDISPLHSLQYLYP